MSTEDDNSLEAVIDVIASGEGMTAEERDGLLEEARAMEANSFLSDAVRFRPWLTALRKAGFEIEVALPAAGDARLSLLARGYRWPRPFRLLGLGSGPTLKDAEAVLAASVILAMDSPERFDWDGGAHHDEWAAYIAQERKAALDLGPPFAECER